MSLVVDENGNPFYIIREQAKKRRITGLEAQRANILACCRLGQMLKSSLGPCGMDKIIISPDGDVAVTNDGATILDKVDVGHQCARLLAELSKSQDDEIGDGTTGVVVFACELLKEALKLLDKKIHPIKVAEAFEEAFAVASSTLSSMSRNIKDVSEKEFVQFLKSAAMTALSSKVVSTRKESLADMCVRAVLCVADRERGEVVFDLIKVEGKPGGKLEDTCLIEGVVLDKDFSHPQMAKSVKDVRLAILTCPFEPPKPKTKHHIDIRSAEDCFALLKQEQQFFIDMVAACKNSGANVVVCQWGLDDEANHLLLKAGLPTIRWVGGMDIELLAMATGARIVPRFEELTADKLGKAAAVREVVTGTTDSKMILFEGCQGGKAVTIVVHGGNSTAVDEAKRSIHDALCVVRNLVRRAEIVAGGGAPEIACALAIEKAAAQRPGSVQLGMKAYANALMGVPEALAVNAGLDGISTVGAIRAQQTLTNNPNLGLICRAEGQVQIAADAIEEHVQESFLSKKLQMELPTQVARMVLKIDDIICSVDEEF